jgi:hypothetical protein
MSKEPEYRDTERLDFMLEYTQCYGFLDNGEYFDVSNREDIDKVIEKLKDIKE